MIYVVDTETTGDKPPEAAICEIATTPVTPEGKVLLSKSISCLVNPGHAIPAGARGVHHISDKDVAKAPPIGKVMKTTFKHLTQPGVIVLAHNMPYDEKYLDEFLPKDAVKLCSLRMARNLYPDSPDHKNQTLRYHLDCDPPAAALKGMAPHRARYDTICTAFILARMIKDHGFEKLLELSSKPILLETCHLKAHKGKPWSEVPSGYLNWILSADFDIDTVHTARHWLVHRRNPAMQPA